MLDIMEIHSITSFVEYFDKIHHRTQLVVDCIPPEHLEWTIQEGRFSIGDTVRHLGAIERYMYAENARCQPSQYPGHGQELASGYEEVQSFFAKMHRESMEIFRSLSDEDLERKCETPAGVRITVWKWLRAMVEHEVHHRGQLYLYLGVLGVKTPPIFGLTSEQVREISSVRAI
jgi:uncharacterized damage-inducible protein DinB